MEFDGPSRFLASGAPSGATLLKRRTLQLLGHALVSVPYWEWEVAKGAGERELYLWGKRQRWAGETGGMTEADSPCGSLLWSNRNATDPCYRHMVQTHTIDPYYRPML